MLDHPVVPVQFLLIDEDGHGCGGERLAARGDGKDRVGCHSGIRGGITSAIAGEMDDLVVVDEGDAIDKIRPTVRNDRVKLAIDGVAGKSSALIASMLSVHGTFVVYAYMAGGRSRSARST